ncbi:MAG: lipoyl synthase [Thermoprotei archaeon]
MDGRKPSWLSVRIPGSGRYLEIKSLKASLGLSTVCEEARCPNIGECWGGGTATFMLMGDTCTRHCRFCAVKSGKPNGYLDPQEPLNLAYAVKQMGLDYVVVTSVDRDDLSDGGASHIAKAVREIKRLNPGIYVEVLVPDFRGSSESVETVLEARPDVFAHNVETVRRLTPKVRDPRASFDQSLSVLRAAKQLCPDIYTKSSIMVGLGETEPEVASAMMELRNENVDFLTIGQYLQPTAGHISLAEYVPPSQFERYKKIGEELGFKYVAAGPLVRSSYRAGEYYLKNCLVKASS